MDNFRVFVESGEIINSISDIFPSAALFENEIAELFGVDIDCVKPGLPRQILPNRQRNALLQGPYG